MKAIEINGKIEVFRTIPNSFKVDGKYIAGGGKNLSDDYLKSLGFKDVVEPTYDERIEELSNLHLNGDTYTYDVIDKPIKKTLAELKSEKIGMLKFLMGEKLRNTDWYIIREADGGKSTPQSIKDERIDLRTQSNTMEEEINSLTNKKAVVLFDINL